MASASSAPSVSMVTFEPLPAASIMTPMMLLALMRRVPLLIHTSHLYLPASWVSLAEARACSPSLLMICVSLVSMSAFQQVENAIAAAVAGTNEHSLEVLVAIGQGAEQHREIRPGQAFDAARLEEFQCQVGRAGAVDVA